MISFDEYVDVIGHKAVRNNRKALIVGCTRQLHQHEVDGLLVDEDATAVVRADRQEIAVEPKIVKRLEARRESVRHAEPCAGRIPGKADLKVRLYVRATPHVVQWRHDSPRPHDSGA